jgi:hypothetical protein
MKGKSLRALPVNLQAPLAAKLVQNGKDRDLELSCTFIQRGSPSYQRIISPKTGEGIPVFCETIIHFRTPGGWTGSLSF